MAGSTTDESSKVIALTGLVPMIQVADVERSIEFYSKLGFEVGNYVPRVGPKHWAWLYCPSVENWKHGANLMVSSTEGAVEGKAQNVLFYLYVADLVTLRDGLIAKGVKVGKIEYPEHLPEGEFWTKDPDGYRLMVAQS